MPNNDLAALSEAAKWLRECCDWLLATDLVMQCPMEANPADLADNLDALVATGRLVQIDEGMRERVWKDYRFQAACHRYAHEGGSSEAIAAAVIAAMMGGAK